MSVTNYDGLGTGITNQSFGDEVVRDPDDNSMDEEQFAGAVKAAIDDAAMYIDGYVAPTRELATRYYNAEPFGNEEDGRSQFVMSEVRDTILAMLPSLLRIFTSSDQAVSFEPRSAEKVAMAEQATDYVNFIFYSDNPGFEILYNAFKDALVRKSGILKWRWDDDIEVYEVDFTDLSDAQMQILENEEGVEILSDETKPDPNAPPLGVPAAVPASLAPPAAGAPPMAPAAPMPMAPPPGGPPMDMAAGPGMGNGPVLPPPGMPVMPPPVTQATASLLHDVKIRRHRKKGRVRVESLPVEEFICSRTARDLETAPLIGHRSLRTMSDLVAMGYDEEEIEEASGMGDTFVLNSEAQARNPAVNAWLQTPDVNDESQSKLVYNEVWVRIDKDGDGIAELHKVCMVNGKVLYDEVVRDVPMAIMCPDPEPHNLIGNSVADQTMDIQLLMSNIVRNTLDSLAQSIHPRTVIVEGAVNIDDALNVATGAIIRCKAPGMIQPLSEPFVGQAALPMIQWLQEVKALRTGIIPATAGLDPDVLQSTTKTAVDAAVMGAQERTEMTARLFAENGIKPLMKGLLKLICQHQDKPRMMRLRGKWVEVDPREWDADMDVVVHVALGRGTEQNRLAALSAILAKQELAIQLGGTSNPLADLSHYRNTLSKMVETMGYKDVQQFFAPIDQQQIQMMEQQKAQNPPPDPNMLVAQAEMAKSQSMIQSHQMQDQMKAQQQQFEQQLETQRIQLEVWKAQMEDARERDRMRLEAVVEAQKNEVQLGMAAATAENDSGAERDRLMSDLVKSQLQSDRDADATALKLGIELHKHAATLANKLQIEREKPKPTANGGTQ